MTNTNQGAKWEKNLLGAQKNNQLQRDGKIVGVRSLRPHQAGGPKSSRNSSLDAAFYNRRANVRQDGPRWNERPLSPRMLLDVRPPITTMARRTNFCSSPGVNPGTIPPSFRQRVADNTGAAGDYSDQRRTDGVCVDVHRSQNERHNVSPAGKFLQQPRTERRALKLPEITLPDSRRLLANGVGAVPPCTRFQFPDGLHQPKPMKNRLFPADKWTPVNRLTLNLGVRFAKSMFFWINRLPPGNLALTCQSAKFCSGADGFLAGPLLFPAVRESPDYSLVHPRIFPRLDLTRGTAKAGPV